MPQCQAQRSFDKCPFRQCIIWEGRCWTLQILRRGNHVKRGFLVVGIICTLAALFILSKQRNLDPRSAFGRSKARPEYHNCIWRPSFSPDGKKLLFRLRDESGTYTKEDTYLYSLNDKTIRKLPISRGSWSYGSPWAPDSMHIIINEGTASKIFSIETNTFVERLGTRLRDWSPDGKTQLFSNYYTGDKYLKDVRKGTWTILPPVFRPQQLYWTHDGKYLLYVDRKSRGIMRYGLKDDNVAELVSLKNYSESVGRRLFPSPNGPYVYLATPRSPSLANSREEILQKLDIRSGQLTKAVDFHMNPKEEQFIQVFPSRDNTVIYYAKQNFEQRERTGCSVVKFDTVMARPEVLLEGPYFLYDSSNIFSEMTNVLAVKSEDQHILYLFNVRTKTLEQIFPPEDAA